MREFLTATQKPEEQYDIFKMLKKVTVNLGLLNFEELKNLSTMKTPGLTVLWESDTKLYRTFFFNLKQTPSEIRKERELFSHSFDPKITQEQKGKL